MPAVWAPVRRSPEACLKQRWRDRGPVLAFQISKCAIALPLFDIQRRKEQGKQHEEAQQDQDYDSR